MKYTELYEKKLGGFKVLPLELDLDEAIKLGPAHRIIPPDEMQGMLGRVKSKQKTAKDRLGAFIHASNITRSNDPNDEWDLAELKRKITKRPKTLMGTNAKMKKSSKEGEMIYDLTLPALKGIVVDEETGDFVEITTCPKAGECQLYCYARKGGYVMFPSSSMSTAQSLNFLVNDPEGFSKMVNDEILLIKKRISKHRIQLVVRWHDAGDFFSKQYLDLAFDVAKANPDVKFYAYTKVADVATSSKPDNFLFNFSTGAKKSEVIQIQKAQAAGKTIKQAITVPRDMFYDLIARKGRKLFKDAQGRTQFRDTEAEAEFKDRLAKKYQLDSSTIITYDEMLNKPETDTPKWNVIVQPGAGDRAANRRDVLHSFLLWHG